MKFRQFVFVHASIFVMDVLLDQASKLAILYLAGTGEPKFDWIRNALTYNRGISWGMLHGASDTVFWAMTALIAVITAYIAYLGIQRISEGYLALGNVYVVAGSVSNLIDRVVHGGVVDFISISFWGWDFPVFNLADCFIVFGILQMMFPLNRQLFRTLPDGQRKYIGKNA